MSTFQEQLELQLNREQTIQRVCTNFGKESKKRLKVVPRLADWYVRIEDLWSDFRIAHDELTVFENEFIASDYFSNRIMEKLQTKVEAMKEKIKTTLVKLGKPIEEFEERSKEQIEETVSQSEGQRSSTQESDDSEASSTPADQFKTPRGKFVRKRPTFNVNFNNELDDEYKTPRASQTESPGTSKDDENVQFPSFVLRYPELKNRAEEAVGRVQNKMRRFSNNLDNIEKCISDGLLVKARLLLRNIEKHRINLDEGIEEITFMLGNGATQYEKECNALMDRHTTLLEVMEPRGKSMEQRNALKLKPIEIPKFSGTLQQWPTFSGLFRTMVIEEKAYNDIERMQYLKTSITGEAAKLISTMEITADNFQKAWQILVNRFENKRAIRDAHVETLLQLPTITKETSIFLRDFYDKSKECVELLSDVSKEQVILYVLVKKLPFATRKTYEQSLSNPRNEQDLDEYFDFLNKHCQMLESIEGNTKRFDKRSESYQQSHQQGITQNQHRPMTPKEKCACCDDANHAVFMCEKFKKMTVAERREVVRDKALCLLCLRATPKHLATECRFKKMCPTCDKRHNGLLHDDRAQKPSKEVVKKSFFATAEEVFCAMACIEERADNLLATALIRVRTESGRSEVVRALVDQGSMATFISERLVKMLNLQRRKTHINVTGVVGSAGTGRCCVDIEISPRYPSSFKINTTAVVMDSLTTLLPLKDSRRAEIESEDLESLVFADPRYNKSGKIDMILGNEVHSVIILDGKKKPADKSFVVEETELGWIVSGLLRKNKRDMANTVCMTATISDLDMTLQQFWQVEKMPSDPVLSEEDRECMNHFNATVSRDSDGVYVVSLPFKINAPELGNSRKMALAQYLQLEKKHARDPELKTMYNAYISELIERGFMKKCEQPASGRVCYLPHHGVRKESSTTKVRPVYNASQKTSNGIALNDILMKGPRLQQDIFDILLRFRVNKIAFVADIEKMYLHVRLNEDDQDLQRILHRVNPNGPIEDYVLATVTFGINCSPFLAVAVIQHHVKKFMEKYPEACKIILDDSYMDDLSSGSYHTDKAIDLQRQITNILADASFPLRKWVSNSGEFMQSIPECDKEGVSVTTENSWEKSVATLGLLWFYGSDKLSLKTTVKILSDKMTKRAILSDIASIYDPLGLLAPVTIYNKIIMQDIWREKIDWDDEVSKETAERWSKFKEQLPVIGKIKVNRWFKYQPGATLELHGFSDASESAMGACIYTKVIHNGEIHVNLLTAKTKVAPMEKITLPRLELCAAVMLAKLMDRVKRSLNVRIEDTHYYSDSEITLAWIRGDASRWKTFVANRVSKIKELSEFSHWHYINTKANPADFASRGLLPNELRHNELWWHGPSVLLNEQNCAPEKIETEKWETKMEEKKVKTTVFTATTEINSEIMDKFSSFEHAARTIAFCKRYLVELQQTKGLKTVIKDENSIREACKKQLLTPEELEKAKTALIKACQVTHFGKEMRKFTEKDRLPKESKLKPLYPFVDHNGLLRIGGRLQHSEFSFNKKHPIIIPYGSSLMKAIINDAHKQTFHGGNQITLNQIRQEYWILSGKRAVKSHINSCVVCHRFRNENSHQLMGSLPAARSKIMQKPFTHTGTDLCGPFHYKAMRARGVVTSKGYVVIFVCLTTRAIHIELVSDMTAEAFVASFRRLIGRRGHVRHLYCDNGGNFTKGNTFLKLENEQAIEKYNIQIAQELSAVRTKFHFNPAYSPWMGGIWERAVGSVKYHLKRTIKDQVLSYEEFTTVLTQVEAILNSRPISPLSENPEDLDVLTPGHFLIGTALTAPIETDHMSTEINRLNRWELCGRLKQEFWAKWANEYITLLQKRHKWAEKQRDFKVGDMVLLKEENSAPLQWPLGRIERVYRGGDDNVRVAEIFTRGKICKRPIVKLALLPILDNKTNENDSTMSKWYEQKIVNKTNNDLMVQSDTVDGQTPLKRDEEKKPEKTVCHAITIEDDTQQIQWQRKRGCGWSPCSIWGKAVTWILSIALMIYTVYGQNHSIRHFEPRSVAYVEDCGIVNEITGYWNLAVRTNLDIFYQNVDQLHNSLDELRRRCGKGKKESICGQVVSNFEKRLEVIIENEKAIKNKVAMRNKRGLGLFVLGSVLGSAGVMLYNWIVNPSDTANLRELLRKQTSVLELTAQTMEKELNNTSVLLREEAWAVVWLTQAFENVVKSQKEILKMIVNEEFDINGIPIDVMIMQMKIIGYSIKDGRHPFGENTLEQALNAYKVARVKKIVVAKDSVIAIIGMPISNNKTFACKKITPVPFMRTESFEIVTIQRKYVLANGNEFAIKNEQELNNCIQASTTLLCELGEVIEKNTNMCELQIVLNKQESNCITTEYSSEKFLKKVGPAAWIFSTNSSRLEIRCNNTTYETQVHGSGLIELSPECTAKMDVFTMQVLNYNTNNVTLSAEKWHSVSLSPAGSGNNSLTQLKTAIHELKEETKWHTVWHVHHTTILYAFVAWVLFCVCLLKIRRMRNAPTQNITIQS